MLEYYENRHACHVLSKFLFLTHVPFPNRNVSRAEAHKSTRDRDRWILSRLPAWDSCFSNEKNPHLDQRSGQEIKWVKYSIAEKKTLCFPRSGWMGGVLGILAINLLPICFCRHILNVPHPFPWRFRTTVWGQFFSPRATLSPFDQPGFVELLMKTSLTNTQRGLLKDVAVRGLPSQREPLCLSIYPGKLSRRILRNISILPVKEWAGSRDGRADVVNFGIQQCDSSPQTPPRERFSNPISHFPPQKLLAFFQPCPRTQAQVAKWSNFMEVDHSFT